MYDVRLVYPPEYPKDSIDEALFRFGEILLWQPEPDPAPQLLKSILKITDSPSVGFVHSYRDLSVKSSEYTVAIYPPQFRRTIGINLGELESEQWAAMNVNRLVVLHEALFLLIGTMQLETPLLCASICPEDWGHVEPLDCGYTICIARQLAVSLSIPATSVDKMPYFVSVDL